MTVVTLFELKGESMRKIIVLLLASCISSAVLAKGVPPGKSLAMFINPKLLFRCSP